MKKVTLILLVIFSLLLTGAIPEEKADQLQTLASIATDNNLPIHGFEVVIKEDLPSSNFKHLVNNPKNSHFVTVSKEENTLKYHRTDQIENEKIEIETRLLFSEINPEKVELTVVIRGSNWNQDTEAMYKQLKEKIMDSYFENNATVFACIEVTNGDIIGDRVVVDIFSEALDLVHNLEQHDSFEMSKLKKVIYGYTDLWNDKFIVEGIPFNLQIAGSKSETGDWEYMIGTPILVNEY